jgi:thioredoxin reductase
MSASVIVKKHSKTPKIEQINENDILQAEIDKLIGIDGNSAKYNSVNKNEWKNCVYCEKFHHADYFVTGMNYCVHCWAWLNGHEYDIVSGVYSGVHSQNDVNKTIKKVYSVHNASKCVNELCLFNKIKQYAENKILHSSLVEMFELNKKPKQMAICFNHKNKYLNVDFEESYIVI